MSDAASIFARARAYPYDPPPFGYRFHHQAAAPERVEAREIVGHAPVNGEVPVSDVTVALDGNGALRRYERRVAVIAAGSNASFTRLKSKFAAAGAPGDFPVLKARVRGLVSVYSAHVSRYGSIPGTLTGEDGAVSELHVAFLDPGELKRLNGSESIGKNYALALIDGLKADFGNGCVLDAALAYVSLRGAYAPDGAPVRISTFRAEGSRHVAAGQEDILERARRHLAHDGPLERFVHEHAEDEAVRTERVRIMAASAVPCRIAGMRFIAGRNDAPEARLPNDFS
jgi:hypothetical protein